MDENTVSAPRTEKSLSAALSYIRRGWPVLILHNITEQGICSCGDVSENHQSGSAGKHPVAKAWRQAAITDETVMASVLAGRPEMNLGILTGVSAGIWVLDVDPRHGGLQGLLELTTKHGELPHTYTVRTGSGGFHYYWSLPDDFTPTNSAKRLPGGLDVRGEGGQVVAPPSVSHAGAYELILELPVVSAPGWLLERIRPAMPSEIVRGQLEEGGQAYPFGVFGRLASPNTRLTSYALSAANQELARLRDAVPGQRNTTAFEVACSLIELVNSPWTGLDGQQVWAAYLVAAEHASAHGGFDQNEAVACWQSAARRVGARGRPVPDAMPGGVAVGWDLLGGVPPFSLNNLAPMPDLIVSPSTNGDGNSHLFPSLPPVEMAGIPAAQPHVDLFPPQFPPVPTGDLEAPVQQDPVQGLISRFLSIKQLSELPPPSWLIDGWLVRNSFAMMVGKSNDGKSFVALDMALHVATGKAWRGRPVHQCRVGYVVAEGAEGMGQRGIAWQKTYNDDVFVEDDRISMLPMPIQAANNAEWDLLIAAVAHMRIELVILDTQARITVGLEENSAKEMGLFVEQVERLRRATGATVLVVHHLDKQGRSGRGSGAVYAAAQTELTVSRAADLVTITVTKQKDSARAEPLNLRLADVEVGRKPGWAQEPITAGVLLDVDEMQAAEWAGLSAKARVLKVLLEIFPGRGATKAEARTTAAGKGVPTTSFYRAWDALLTEGLIAKVMIDDRPTERYVSIPIDQRPKQDLLVIPHQRAGE